MLATVAGGGVDASSNDAGVGGDDSATSATALQGYTACNAASNFPMVDTRRSICCSRMAIRCNACVMAELSDGVGEDSSSLMGERWGGE